MAWLFSAAAAAAAAFDSANFQAEAAWNRECNQIHFYTIYTAISTVIICKPLCLYQHFFLISDSWNGMMAWCHCPTELPPIPPPLQESKVLLDLYNNWALGQGEKSGGQIPSFTWNFLRIFWKWTCGRNNSLLKIWENSSSRKPHKINRIRIFFRQQIFSVKLAMIALRVYSLQFPPLAQSITPYRILSITLQQSSHVFAGFFFAK